MNKIVAFIALVSLACTAQYVTPMYNKGASGGTSNSFTGGANKDACVNFTAAQTTCVHGIVSTTGRLLVGGAIIQDGTGTISCSDTTNGSWTPIGTISRGTGAAAGFSWQNFYVIATGTGASTLTCTSTVASIFNAWTEGDFSATGTITIDGTPFTGQVTASASVATYTGLSTTFSNDLLVATCMFAQGTCSLGSGFTSDDNGFNVATGGLGEYKLNLASSGAQTATFGTSGATDVVGGGYVAFKAQ